MPIRLIHDRWIDKYTQGRVSALADLKNEMEDVGAGGGWSWVLSDLKTLLETGKSLAG